MSISSGNPSKDPTHSVLRREQVEDITLNPKYIFYDTYMIMDVSNMEDLYTIKEKRYKYFFIDNSTYKWDEFIECIQNNLEKNDDYQDKHKVLYEWKKCRECSSCFEKMSKLLNSNKKRIIFSNDINSYPKEMRPAILKLKEIKDIYNEVVFGISNTCCTIYEFIYKRPVPQTFDHIVFNDHITSSNDKYSIKKCININYKLRTYQQMFKNNINTWKLHKNALKCMFDAYHLGGDSKPGYNQNYKPLKWFYGIMNQVSNKWSEQTLDIFIINELIKHLMNSSSGGDIIGWIHTFSKSGNLYECINVSKEEQFWNLLKDRYDPLSYKVSTAIPKELNLESAISQFGQETLEHMFKRETWDINDPRLQKWLYYNYTNTNTLDINQLRNIVKKPVQESNCFSSSVSVSNIMSIEEFKIILSQNCNNIVEWRASEYHEIIYGFPTHESGRQYSMVEGNWAMVYNPTYPKTLYSPDTGWVKVDAIGSHANTWKSNFPEKILTSGLNSGIHKQMGGLAKGITITVNHSDISKITENTNRLPTNQNVLFQDFFNSEIHKYRKIRQLYHDKTSLVNIVKTPYGGVHIPIISVSHGITEFKYGVKMNNKKCQVFRIQGKTYNVY